MNRPYFPLRQQLSFIRCGNLCGMGFGNCLSQFYSFPMLPAPRPLRLFPLLLYFRPRIQIVLHRQAGVKFLPTIEFFPQRLDLIQAEIRIFQGFP